MGFYKVKNIIELKGIVSSLYKKDFILLLDFISDILNDLPFLKLPNFVQKKLLINQAKHSDFAELFIILFDNDDFIIKLYKKLSQDEHSKKLYEILIWEQSEYSTDLAISDLKIKLEKYEFEHYASENEQLQESLSLISREIYYNSGHDIDNLYISAELRKLLKLAFPFPDDYNMNIIEKTDKTDYTYTNENEVLNFIDTIEKLLQNNLIEFSKTNEKPLLKSLNILKSTSGINEFFTQDKKLNNVATDMLTRSFAYYYYTNRRFRDTKMETLKEFVSLQFNDKLTFYISRIFTSHLKKIRFDEYYTTQSELFIITKNIINDIPKDGWVNFDNILKYCRYREYRFDFESKYKTGQYYLESDDTEIYAKEHYDIIVFEPVLKAIFFYLASLGVVELKYNTPTSPYTIKGKNKSFISMWDQLKYIKFTKLGLFLFDFTKNYEVVDIKKDIPKLKFDQYKPIITVDCSDTIMLAKLEPYCEQIDVNRYILKHSKIFKECQTYKALELKIEAFYNNIEQDLPKVFIKFFDDIKIRSNMLKSDLDYVVIKLEKDKELLNLFMSNKKLQDLILKVEGYRVMVLKSNINKFTTIVKNNGYFVEF